MGAQDKHLSSQDILNLVQGIHGTADDASPVYLKAGGKFVNQPTANQGGDTVVFWVSQEGYLRPHMLPVSIFSFTTAATAGTSDPLTGLGAFLDSDIYVDVTAASGTVATLGILIDARLDGTNYSNIAQLAAITTTGQYAGHITKRQSSNGTTLSGTADFGTFRAVGFGDAIRLRRQISGTSPSFSANAWVTFNA